MRFVSFEICNYKGISHCKLDVDRADPRVLALIGLNESGKTTILEAINHFVASDRELQRMYNAESSTVTLTDFVPKSKKLNFNGQVEINAALTMDDSDISAVAAACEAKGYISEPVNSSAAIHVKQYFHFKNSDYDTQNRTWSLAFRARKKNGTKWHTIDANHPCWQSYHQTLLARIPQICYFPTFLFELPDKIYIEPHPKEEARNLYYRKLIQDVLDSLNADLDVKTHIVDRIRGAETGWSWFSFLQTDRREQVNHVLLTASTKITSVIMDSWRKVFNKSFDSKRIDIEYGHDAELDLIYIKLFLVDGSEKYEIGTRSLGFRWFFCFWLFTHFRTLRSGASGVVFLLDEPASNLHARAQEEILSNIEQLATANNLVIYSTHSHYLINPRWLDRAYIVSNGAVSYGGVGDEFKSAGETNISASLYRVFAGKHPNQKNYFLPVLDALDYRPSELTMERPALLTEGKADFAFFKAAWIDEDFNFSVVPGSGAKSFDPLIGMLSGWGFGHILLLDDDKEGREAKAIYNSRWNLGDDRNKTLKSFVAEFANKSLEDILLVDLSEELSSHFSVATPTKHHVQSYLHEMLALGKPLKLSDRLSALSSAVFDWASAMLVK